MQHRLYCFVNNLYMSPIQLGIQSAHGVSTLMAKAARRLAYGPIDDLPMALAAMEWAEQSPTMIVCQGGNVAGLLALEKIFAGFGDALRLPVASFREDEASLGGAITCVCALVPETYFSLSPIRLESGDMGFAPSEDSTVDVSSIDNGLPVTAESHPTLHGFLSIVKTARLA